MKKLIIKNAGMYESDWAIVYLDPNSSFSAGGGRITVITEDQCGSYFFGHVGQPSFEEFIANTRPSYLMGKLFHEIKENIPAEDGQDIIDWIAKNGISELKEARQSNAASKEQVRKLYEELNETGFDNVYNLSHVVDEDCLETLLAIYGEDCLWENGFKKKNTSYEFMYSMINSVILTLKKELSGETKQSETNEPKAKLEKLESGDYLLVPKLPNQDCLNSMAMRYRHDFGLLDDNFRQSITTEMRQLYEEATGQGFYSHEVEKKAAKSTQYEDLSQILSHKIQEQD